MSEKILKKSTPETVNLTGHATNESSAILTDEPSTASLETLKLRGRKPIEELRDSVLAGHQYGVLDLVGESPQQLETQKRNTEEIIDVLFPGNPLLCVGQSEQIFSTHHREHWRGKLEDRQFIVPSPMSSSEGLTQGGKPTKKSNSNTGPRRFLVVEQDSYEGVPIPRDEQAAVIRHLGSVAPLVMAVFSGGKSIHAWFYCEGRTEAENREFMEYAVALGADHKMWTRSQFARMPDGTRANGKRQEVLFFNPDVMS